MDTTTVPEGPPYHPYHLPAPVIIPSLPHEALLYWIFKQFLAFIIFTLIYASLNRMAEFVLFLDYT